KTFQHAPTITSINTVKGIIGTSVLATIAGTGFAGATAVTFSGTGVTAGIRPGGTDSSLPITISIASNAVLDTRTFTVTTTAGTSPAFNGYTVVRPTITAITPAIGTARFSIGAIVTGSNLSGANVVLFSGSGVSAVVG